MRSSFQIVAVVYVAVAQGLFAGDLDRSELLSMDRNVRITALRKLRDRSSTLSEQDRRYILDRAVDSKMAQDLREDILDAAYSSVMRPLGSKIVPISPHEGDRLLQIAEGETNATELRERAVMCLYLALDGSKDGQILEDKMFNLLAKKHPKELRLMVVKFSRFFPIKRDDHTWKHFDRLLRDSGEDEEVRLAVIESLVGMVHARLMDSRDFYELMELSINVETNSSDFRNRVLAIESLYRLAIGEEEVPEWVKTRVYTDFLASDDNNVDLASLAKNISSYKASDPKVVSKAVGLVLDTRAPVEVRKACLLIVRTCKVDVLSFEKMMNKAE